MKTHCISRPQGEPRSLSDYLGQAVVINFWTTWCPPCREEMPALQSAYMKFGEEGERELNLSKYPEEENDKIEKLQLIESSHML
ncbi:MAG: TlpA family protein disulfide reductase, partial [Arenicella sp.]|nr:TlpA family protein disulfide reductase [Arenicella sp.]